MRLENLHDLCQVRKGTLMYIVNNSKQQKHLNSDQSTTELLMKRSALNGMSVTME
jgi:hypothetical protein